ncbi:hypothetical protein Tco_0002391 [Tanacetum coccineum]
METKEVQSMTEKKQRLHHKKAHLDKDTIQKDLRSSRKLVETNKRYLTTEHPSETMVFHNEDGNPARANIKQALGSFKDGDGDGDTQPHKGVKASANSDVMYFFTSAQDGDPSQDDVRLCLGDDLKKAQDHMYVSVAFIQQVVPTETKTNKILVGKKLTQSDLHESLDTYVE